MALLPTIFAPLFLFYLACLGVAAVLLGYGVLVLLAAAARPVVEPALDALGVPDTAPPAWWGPVGGTLVLAVTALAVAVLR